MRVLLLSRYCRLGASSRLRSLQYVPRLSQCGVQVDVTALYDEAYLNELYQSNRRSLKHIALRYNQRLWTLLRSAARYDVLWLEQEIFPWMPPFAELLLRQWRIPFVVDYDDAIFHRYDLHTNWLVRHLLGKKIDTIMQLASVVIAGNSYIADRASDSGAKAVVTIPTVIDLNRYAVKQNKGNTPLTIGWIGSPATFDFLRSIAPILIDLKKRLPIRIVIVGIVDPRLKRQFPFTYYPWSEDTEAELLKLFDIGIMPLPDTPWTRGKCGYKLIQYMACGIPVIASNVGANKDIVNSGENGFLVSKPEEWVNAIERLVADANLLENMGKNGRQQVEKTFNLDKTFPRIASCLLQSPKR
ncbi:glycosyltransferase, family I [Desulfosarcina variabilis str. Montpellier]